jgi:hypothetical protein
VSLPRISYTRVARSIIYRVLAAGSSKNQNHQEIDDAGEKILFHIFNVLISDVKLSRVPAIQIQH